MINSAKLIDFEDVPQDLRGEAQTLIAAALSEAGKQKSHEPLFIHMCGIPGSGKTTYTQRFLSNTGSFNLVQFDSVMESLTGYQQDCKNHGIEEAFLRWELPARAIGYHLLQNLVEGKRNIFFDHSATNRKHLDLIKSVKKHGYQVEMHFIECSVKEATKRVNARQATIQRHTPLGLISERKQLLEELLPHYEGLVDKFLRVPT
ncbi:AAA family ATPase [bacterium]|nr:AAA family ATPase [bacterium]MBP9807048.1 AAA family ATPase [bacterium]